MDGRDKGTSTKVLIDFIIKIFVKFSITREVYVPL